VFGSNGVRGAQGLGGSVVTGGGPDGGENAGGALPDDVGGIVTGGTVLGPVPGGGLKNGSRGDVGVRSRSKRGFAGATVSRNPASGAVLQPVQITRINKANRRIPSSA
jgi:hypothetical protein